jgi:ubiquinone biosynthesis accessory factor UbiK
MATSPPLPPVLNEIQQRLKVLAESAPAKEFEKNAKAVMASMAQRMDLVPREELDAALAQLREAQARLAVLQARIAALEQQLGGSGDPRA